uniref:Uncharacterized protein n=1 Tax=Marseillevirus LCMAC201 TaxID=2506605 RepID=A0A481YWN4_9VIRU|nr:MAG: hypothetical protein LCMAC201_05350 [Marseillevirus LCMAC201]
MSLTPQVYTETSLKNAATALTSNDYYFKDIITRDEAIRDNTWYPYTFGVITCIGCKKDSGYRAKRWFSLMNKDVSFHCNECKGGPSSRSETIPNAVSAWTSARYIDLHKDSTAEELVKFQGEANAVSAWTSAIYIDFHEDS